jgi:hypothetical protein
MRVVGFALMVSVLCAACAIQPGDGSYDAPSGSAAPAATGAHVVAPNTLDEMQAGSGAQSAAPAPCTTPGPECDPQPQPWGGRPPVYVPTAKQ